MDSVVGMWLEDNGREFPVDVSTALVLSMRYNLLLLSRILTYFDPNFAMFVPLGHVIC